MNFKFYVLSVILTGISMFVQAQTTFPLNGITDNRHVTYAFTNARLYIDYKTVVDSAVLLIRDGKIVDAGKNIPISGDAVVFDLKGKFIYPSFIDPYTNYGIQDLVKPEKGKGPQLSSLTKGAYSWNQALRPEFQSYRVFVTNTEKAEDFRKAGFGTVMSFLADGIARGTGCVVTLADQKEQEVILLEKAAAFYSFSKGSSTQDYPTSQMGAIALLRQSFLDADWYKNGGSVKETNISIEAWNENQNIPQIFETEDKYQAMRADKIGDEFGISFIIKGSGNEYERIDEIKATKCKFIIPLKFPEAIDVTDPYEAVNMTLEDFKHWEMAPANAMMLNKAGVEFAFTTSGLKETSEYLEAVRKAILYGLPPEEALKACTYTPAVMLGISQKTGSLKKGMLANFIISSGDIFKKDNILFENWIQGQRYVLRKSDMTDIRGNYALEMSGRKLNLKISGDPYNLKAIVSEDSVNVKTSITFESEIVNLKIDLKNEPGKGNWNLSGFRIPSQPRNLKGTGVNPAGNAVVWEAIWKSDVAADIKKDSAQTDKPDPGKVRYPNKAFGFDSLPKPETVLFKNITVWTNEKDGILKNTDVLIQNGKIVAIGKISEPAGARVINGEGKHLTAGIIDEHSHIAISSDV
ncbi:MAG TPA: amidohydrolase family protein, partial [Bacteroidia bacterium]|nr:amidohydrolase family protein [Bacteroidia bacterium]